MISFTYKIAKVGIKCGQILTDKSNRQLNMFSYQEYTEIEQEAPWSVEGKQPPPEWPQEGAVELQNYGTRYRPGLDLVLKGISCKIAHGEKVCY